VVERESLFVSEFHIGWMAMAMLQLLSYYSTTTALSTQGVASWCRKSHAHSPLLLFSASLTRLD
jgi:hypothetical protein